MACWVSVLKDWRCDPACRIFDLLSSDWQKISSVFRGKQMARRGLSKSRFVAGWQCHKQLWWRVHEPDAQELVPDESLQAVFARGTDVGEVARSFISNGKLIDFPHDQIDKKLKATEEAISAGNSVIYEASFNAESVFVAVDILEKVRGGWNLVEVKSTTQAKPEHAPDIAVQLYVLEKAGLKIKRAELMHLNRECRYPDLSNLFARSDLTKAARELQLRVEEEVKAQLQMLDGRLPDVA
ncbi:MAG TPA: Dna2/Cas4 domain-containing protein, partial [Opitutales bacterium]|nr:Dna2/Cas4 domain-containing protein [Opitutales bacterium]